MDVDVQSPLLPQVQKILKSLGYEPAGGKTGLYMPRLGAHQRITGAFFKVSSDCVEKCGSVQQSKPVSHASFVANHVRYLFD